MNSSRDLDIVGNDCIINKSIVTEKKFQLKDSDWHYHNAFQLTLLEREEASKLKIKNHLCELNGNKLRKLTQITLREKNYVIEDVYTIHPHPKNNQQKQVKDGGSTNDSDKNQAKSVEDKKLYIFKKQRRSRKLGEMGEMGEPLNSRNTKNISKNFCKAFLSYLKGKESSTPAAAEAVQIYTQLFTSRVYNNNSIKTMIDNPKLRALFQHFLKEEAAEWIRHSKINDKVLHYEAIGIYLNLFDSVAREQQQQPQFFSSASSSSSSERRKQQRASTNNAK